MARENFKTAKQLPDEKKRELKQKWEEYSNLPPEEKERLKQQAASNTKTAPKTGIAVPPAPHPVSSQPTQAPPAEPVIAPNASTAAMNPAQPVIPPQTVTEITQTKP